MTVTFMEVTNPDGTIVEIAIIDWGNGEYTSMTKAEFDILYPDWLTA